jgi:ABC-type uncharacterized transport system permease subunit
LRSIFRSESFGAVVSSVLAVVVAFAVSLLIVWISGYSVSETAHAFIDGAFGDSSATEATLGVMVPLTLIGLAWILASSANQINLGLEGQILIGGVFATIVGTKITGLPAAVHLPLALAAGALGGALWASIPALLSVYRRVSELLSTFMLNFVAALAVAWLVSGPLEDPSGFTLLQSAPVELSASWPRVGTSQLTWDIVLVPLGVLALTLLLSWTALGFRINLLGANPQTARETGVETRWLGAGALISSGAIAGVVGASLILASIGGTLAAGFSNNYGFLGIAVALVARNSPVGCILSGLLFAALQQGGGLIETRVGLPSSLVVITQGLVIIILAGSALFWGRRGIGRLLSAGAGRPPLATEEH